MTFFKKSYNDNQRGAALVEFAIVLPLLVLLVMGIVEFSFAFYHFNILNKSVQDGTRYFSYPLIARNGNVGSLIDTRSANNATNIQATKNLIIYGDTTVTGQPLLPGVANYVDFKFYCAEQNIVNALCAPTTQHIRVTAVYNHNLITGNLLSGLMQLIGGGNGSDFSAIPLTASSVLRAEGGG
jgi:hypothetical protein